MHHFHYQNGELYAEEVPLREIAAEAGTPVYVYSRKTLTHHYRVFDAAFGENDHLVCYSVKANSNLAVLKIFAALGGGMDIVSGGELYRALKAGTDPQKIVYSGVGKTHEEIAMALKENILMFNVESEAELTKLEEVAAALGKKAPIALRVNPDVDPETHPYISTGMRKNKFGVSMEEALPLYREARKLKHLEVVGLDCHIGSQLTKVEPFVDSLRRVGDLAQQLKKEGFALRYLDLGGGLGITYNQEEPPPPAEYARALMHEAKDLGLKLIVEPGRVLVGNAGILVAKVIYIKNNPWKNFVIVDAAMNDLVRPSLYGSYQGIQSVKEKSAKRIVGDVVGPICESGDFLAKDRELPDFKAGELLAVMGAGAYGFSMSSNYNSRPRAAEVLVDGDDFHIIRQRESYEDLVRGETIPF